MEQGIYISIWKKSTMMNIDEYRALMDDAKKSSQKEMPSSALTSSSESSSASEAGKALVQQSIRKAIDATRHWDFDDRSCHMHGLTGSPAHIC